MGGSDDCGDTGASLAPLRPAWSADDAVGDERVDAPHRSLLALCERLAGHCEAPGTGPAEFADALSAFKALVRDHLRADDGAPAAEREEFDAMVDDVVSTEHFDAVELQRYVALWTLGHIRSCTARERAAGTPRAGDTGA